MNITKTARVPALLAIGFLLIFSTAWAIPPLPNSSGGPDLYGYTYSDSTIPFNGFPPTVEGAKFGSAVAVSSNFMVVGTESSTGVRSSGTAYVFDLKSPTPTLPVLILNNPTPEDGDAFGGSVAISGTRIVVSAFRDNFGGFTNAGTVYVYDLTSSTPTIPVVTLNNPTPASDEFYGSSVAISGTRVVVGAPLVPVAGSNLAGEVYIYDLNRTTPEIPVSTLRDSNPGFSDLFGNSVAIDGNRVLVGALQDNNTMSSGWGSASYYQLNPATSAAAFVNKVTNPSTSPGGFFGVDTAISGTRVMIGGDDDNNGTVHIYDLASGTFSHKASLPNPSTNPGSSSTFGYSLSISDNRAVVGSSIDNTFNSSAGGAWVYDIDPVTSAATLDRALTFPSAASSDNFGSSVAISGPRVVVGAPGDNPGVPDGGSVFTYLPPFDTPTAFNQPGNYPPHLLMNSPISSPSAGTWLRP